MDIGIQFASKFLQLNHPEPNPSSVGATTVGGDQQARGSGIELLSQTQPSPPDAFHGESGRVMADADIHPTDFVSHVLDPVRRRLAELLVGEVMDIDLLGPALGPPLTLAVPEVSHQFHFPGIH